MPVKDDDQDPVTTAVGTPGAAATGHDFADAVSTFGASGDCGLEKLVSYGVPWLLVLVIPQVPSKVNTGSCHGRRMKLSGGAPAGPEGTGTLSSDPPNPEPALLLIEPPFLVRGASYQALPRMQASEPHLAAGLHAAFEPAKLLKYGKLVEFRQAVPKLHMVTLEYPNEVRQQAGSHCWCQSDEEKKKKKKKKKETRGLDLTQHETWWSSMQEVALSLDICL
ncbi:hypothetical protein S40288_10904 [Stachybotrys chartarum IBT 40288]|nr:hypothetical protein S40288_10904 [Stachybotrys chartarum IBT 40288]